MKHIENTLKIYLGSFFIIILTISCSKDFLDRPPYGSSDQDTYLSTQGAGLRLLTNCYMPMWSDWDFQTMRFDIGDQLTDDAAKGGSDAGDRSAITDIVRGNPIATNEILTNLWAHRYRTAISNCNVLLDVVTSERIFVDANGALVAEAEKERWRAEAYFMRAFYYYDLAVVFSEIPLIDKPMNVIDKNTIVKESKEKVKEFILKDLAAAIDNPNLPSVKSMPDSETGRITKEAAMSFRARVNMFYGDYNAAKADLKAVYDAQCYGLVANYEDLFNSKEKGYLSEESVFVILREYIPSFTGGSVCPQMNLGRGAVGGWGGQCPTNDLVNEFEAKDPRLAHSILSSGDKFQKPDGSVEVHDYTGYDNFALQHSRKQYPDWSRRQNGNLFWTDWTFYLIRYADVLLMYAECLIETGDNLTLAADLINTVRYRAFVTTTNKDSYALDRKFNIPDDQRVTEAEFNANYKITSTGKDELLKAVRHERRVELNGEGLRLQDLLRWGIYTEKMQALAKTAEGQYSNAGKNTTEKTWPFPIPQNEINYVGGALVQHDNY